MKSATYIILAVIVSFAAEKALAYRTSRYEKRNLWQGIYPGTKWCGLNDIAKSPDDLGKHRATDICCRAHDNECSVRMRALEKKYHVRNWSATAVSHCDCEKRFKNCLLKAGTTAAKGLLGIYFHVIKPKCIRLKPYTYRKCVKRSWFKCIKYVSVHSKKAHFYDLDKEV